MPKDNININF